MTGFVIIGQSQSVFAIGFTKNCYPVSCDQGVNTPGNQITFIANSPATQTISGRTYTLNCWNSQESSNAGGTVSLGTNLPSTSNCTLQHNYYSISGPYEVSGQTQACYLDPDSHLCVGGLENELLGFGSVTVNSPAGSPPPPSGGTPPPPPPSGGTPPPPPPPPSGCTTSSCQCSVTNSSGGVTTSIINGSSCTSADQATCQFFTGGNPGWSASTQTITVPSSCSAPPPPSGGGGGGGSCVADYGCGCDGSGLPYTWLSCHQDLTTATVIPDPVEVGTDLTIHAHSTASTNAALIWISYGTAPQTLFVGDIFCTGLSPRDNGGVGNLTNVQDITFNCNIPGSAQVGPYSWELEMGNGWATGTGTIMANVPTPTATITHVQGSTTCLPTTGDDGSGILITWGSDFPVDHLFVAEQRGYSGVFTSKAVSGTSTDGQGFILSNYKFWPGITYYFQTQGPGGYTSEWSDPLTPVACANTPGPFTITQAVSSCVGGLHNHIVWSSSSNTTFYSVNGGSAGWAPAWLNLSYDDYGVSAGSNYDYTVIAGNAYGSTSSNTVNVVAATCDTIPPTNSSITVIPSGTCWSPDSWSPAQRGEISGTSADNPGGSGIQKVELYGFEIPNYAAPIFGPVLAAGTTSWTAIMPTNNPPLQPGHTYTLRALATDNGGLSTWSAYTPFGGFLWNSSAAACAAPFLDTTKGDVHSNTKIDTQGGQ